MPAAIPLPVRQVILKRLAERRIHSQPCEELEFRCVRCEIWLASFC